MPIVDVELVTDAAVDAGLPSRLADAIGRALGAREGGTWVRLRMLPRSHYGESGGPVPDDVRPVFVTITAQHGAGAASPLARAGAITQAVADVTGHPRANVHLVVTPDARGRVAFGGVAVGAADAGDPGGPSDPNRGA